MPVVYGVCCTIFHEPHALTLRITLLELVVEIDAFLVLGVHRALCEYLGHLRRHVLLG